LWVPLISVLFNLSGIPPPFFLFLLLSSSVGAVMTGVEARIDETALIARCQKGDLTAFDTLINANASRIYSLTYRMLGTEYDAEDAAQEAFLRAFSALSKFRRGATFSTWLYRIAVNVCLDEIRHRRGRPQTFSSLLTPDDATGADPSEESLLSIPADDEPSQIIDRQAQKQDIEKALAALPDQQRIVVILCDIDDLSYEEAAEALKMNVGTVKSRLHRARLRLRELLSPKGELLTDK
jgi:RNA polymerase sigma-70 factor, ECF subfamily